MSSLSWPDDGYESVLAESLANFNLAEENIGRPPVMIEDGDLIIPEPRRLFNDILAKITRAVQLLVDAASEMQVVLHGEFGDSSMLRAHLETELAKTGVRLITIPAHQSHAVIRGAVLSAFRTPPAPADVVSSVVPACTDATTCDAEAGVQTGMPAVAEFVSEYL